jgi:hypothetical protein
MNNLVDYHKKKSFGYIPLMFSLYGILIIVLAYAIINYIIKYPN